MSNDAVNQLHPAATVTGPTHPFFCTPLPTAGASAPLDVDTTSPQSANTPANAPDLSTLQSVLPLSPSSNLSRSQSIFAIATGIDPRALSIGRGDEFFEFMAMRQEFGWATFNMNPKRWADFTKIYNTRLAALAQRKGLSVVMKNPRALQDKLGEIEPQIANRIYKQNFLCTCPALSNKFLDAYFVSFHSKEWD